MTTRYLFISIFNLSLLFGQNKKTEELDHILFVESHKLDLISDYKASIKLNKEVLEEAKKINYIRGIAWAHTKIANSYSNYGEFKESLKSLTLAVENSVKLNDPALKAAIAIGYGKNYNEQKLSFSLAIRKFREAENIANTIKNPKEKKYWLNYSYKNLISSYSNEAKWDSTYYYMHKSYNLDKKPYNSEALAYYHLNISKNTDSIKYYLNDSKALLDQNPQLVFERSIYYNLLGDFHFQCKDYENAIKNYMLTIRPAEKSAASNEQLKALRGIADSYEKLEDTKNALIFQNKHNKVRDSLDSNLIGSLDYSIQNIVNDTKEKTTVRNQKLVRILLLITSIVLLISLIYYGKMKLNSKRRKIQFLKNRELIRDKEALLHVKNQEIEVLQSQMNENFERLIYLAKTNDQNFYVRFQETYPNFQANLLSINKDLTVSDLTFCSYLYLDFQTKEIAEYTFKSIKTVQNRKNSLRKKLAISSTDDLYVWMKRMV